MVEHYYTPKQNSTLRLKKISVILRNKKFDFLTASGVFSKNKIDLGTTVLINNAILKPNWKVLDLGCGIGCVGLTLNNLFPDIELTMVDINPRAVYVARLNARDFEIKCKIKTSNMFQKITDKFNTILLNPPQHAGKEICFQLIEESINYLETNGILQLVARHQKGGKTLEKKMLATFGNVKQIAIKSGFRVYVSTKALTDKTTGAKI